MRSARHARLMSGALALAVLGAGASGCGESEPARTPAQIEREAAGDAQMVEYNRQQSVLKSVELGEGFTKTSSEHGGTRSDIHEGESPEEHSEHESEPEPTFSVDIYQSITSPAESIRTITQRLSASGWSVVGAPNETDPANPTAIEARRGEDTLVQIVASLAGEGDAVIDAQYPQGSTQVRVIAPSEEH